MRDPKPLVEEGATEFEHRLLSSARAARPAPEVVRRLERGLGIAAAGAVAVGVPASGASSAASSAAALPAAGIAGPAPSAAVAVTLKLAGLALLVVAGGIGVRLLTWRSVPAPTAVEIARLTAPSIAPAVAPSIAPTVVPATPDEANAGRTAAVSPSVAPPVAPWALRDEIKRIDGARAALAAGSPARALRLLGRYAARYPQGALGPEAMALRIEALDGSGQRGRALTLARAFLVDHPNSPLAARIARLRNAEPNPTASPR